jgi:hypothetical protein
MNFVSDWPVYIFMVSFVIFFVYIIIMKNAKKCSKKIYKEKS